VTTLTLIFLLGLFLGFLTGVVSRDAVDLLLSSRKARHD